MNRALGVGKMGFLYLKGFMSPSFRTIRWSLIPNFHICRSHWLPPLLKISAGSPASEFKLGVSGSERQILVIASHVLVALI